MGDVVTGDQMSNLQAETFKIVMKVTAKLYSALRGKI